ncbi:MAG: hypothetical protein UHO63_01280 [Blautia sp.]|nr:hypothetical protein [Blautia sp.]
MKILKQVSTHCYLLESAAPQEQWGRYTFLGFDPKLEITCRNGNMKIGDLKLKTRHPSDYIRQILADRKSPSFSHLPPFTGGLVGYFSYDYFGYTEPAVPGYPEDEQAFQDLDLMLFDTRRVPGTSGHLLCFWGFHCLCRTADARKAV